jgi:hypothetical protein
MFSRCIVTNITYVRGTLHCRKTRNTYGDQLGICGEYGFSKEQHMSLTVVVVRSVHGADISVAKSRDNTRSRELIFMPCALSILYFLCCGSPRPISRTFWLA